MKPGDRYRRYRELGDRFARLIRESHTAAELEVIKERNARQTDPRICHSHDFCDANMVMLDAFERTFGDEPVFYGTDPDQTPTEDLFTWGMAWNYATHHHLTRRTDAEDREHGRSRRSARQV